MSPNAAVGHHFKLDCHGGRLFHVLRDFFVLEGVLIIFQTCPLRVVCHRFLVVTQVQIGRNIADQFTHYCFGCFLEMLNQCQLLVGGHDKHIDERTILIGVVNCRHDCMV